MAEKESKIYFTPEEVNVLIPRLEEHFHNFWSYREKAQEILRELRAVEEDGFVPEEVAHHQMRKSQAHFLLEQAKKSLDAVMEMGCVVKDLDIGLVDFPHLFELEEEEVFLCWKYGEKKVRFWHELDKGYAARKPLLRKIQHH